MEIKPSLPNKLNLNLLQEDFTYQMWTSEIFHLLRLSMIKITRRYF